MITPLISMINFHLFRIASKNMSDAEKIAHMLLKNGQLILIEFYSWSTKTMISA